MVQKSKSIDILLVNSSGTFENILKRIRFGSEQYDFKSLSELRRLISNQKLKILHTIKEKKPLSIYILAKLLGRDIKAVTSDLKLLSKFGLVEFVKENSGQRIRHRPIIATESLNISIKV